jgi:preprotein translocase subunit SecG
METISQFLSYLFNPLPPTVFHYYILLSIVVLIFLGFSVFLRFLVKKNNHDKAFRRLFRSFPAKIETVSAILIICLLARYYRIGFISMRVLLGLTLLAACYLIYKLALTYLKKYPAEKKRHSQQMEKNKYIPGKRHK